MNRHCEVNHTKRHCEVNHTNRHRLINMTYVNKQIYPGCPQQSTMLCALCRVVQIPKLTLHIFEQRLYVETLYINMLNRNVVKLFDHNRNYVNFWATV